MEWKGFFVLKIMGATLPQDGGFSLERTLAQEWCLVSFVNDWPDGFPAVRISGHVL